MHSSFTHMLNTIAFILAVLWIVLVFVLKWHGLVHVLLVVAIILSIVNMSKNPVR